MSAIRLNPSSVSTRTQISADQFKIQSQFEDTIRRTLLEAQDFHELVVTDLPLGWENFLWGSEERSLSHTRKSYDPNVCTLRLKMRPGYSQNCALEWISSSIARAVAAQFVTLPELDHILLQGSTTITFTSGPYRGFRKEPDAFLHTPCQLLPRVMVEVGWSESYSDLLDDMNKLLVGGNGDIKIVLLVKWTKHGDNTVSGIIELYRLGSQGMPRLEQSEVIFPMPPGDPLQTLDIQRRDLYPAPPGHNLNPNQTFPLDVRRLRYHARMNLERDGFIPA